MKALVLRSINELVYDDVPMPHAGPGEVVIHLRTAALNHRDVWIKTGQYAGLRFPIIPGSDGAGVVADVPVAALMKRGALGTKWCVRRGRRRCSPAKSPFH